MQFLQVVSALVCSDKSKYIDLAGLHQRADGFTAAPVDNIDYTRRETVAERFQQRSDKKHAVFSRLEYDGISHNQCREKRGKRLIQRIVVRAHAQRDA